MSHSSTHALVQALHDDFHQSDRSLSGQLGIPRSTVQRIRAQLVERGDIPRASERRQADGTYRAVPRPVSR